MKLKITLILFFMISLPALTYASSRCDCSPSQRTGSCMPTIGMSMNHINLTSDVLACSMVTWYANGAPKVTIVTDGFSSEEWLGSRNVSLEIGSCDICKDNEQNNDKKHEKYCLNEQRSQMRYHYLRDSSHYIAGGECAELIEIKNGFPILKNIRGHIGRFNSGAFEYEFTKSD